MSSKLGQENSSVLAWIKANERLIAINTAILAIINPQQYALGTGFLRAALHNPTALSDQLSFSEVLHAWVSPMTGVIVDSNHPILSYPASNGNSEWYDILMACGYFEGEDFFLPEINLRLRCASRTVIGICSQIFQYQGGRAMTGKRTIFRWYMRSGLWQMLNVPHHSRLPLLHNFAS